MNRGLLAVALTSGVALLIAAVLATAPGGDTALARFPSVESTGGEGVGAAWRWLEATGRRHRRLVAEEARPGTEEVWLLLAPAVALDDQEVSALIDHASAGGLVVWALGEAGEARQPALARRLGARRIPGHGERTVGPLAPHPLFDDLSLRAGGAGVASDRPDARAVLGDGDRPAAAVVPMGRGEVVLLAGPEPLDNRHVGGGGALTLWVRLAARGALVFDERFLRPASAGPVGPVARAGPPVLLGAQLGLVVLVLAAALWPRFGAVRPPPPEQARATTGAYLASLAELYRLAGAEPELAAATWRRLRRRMERDAGVAAGLPAEEAARRLAASAPAAAEALRRGEAALARGGQDVLLQVAQAAAEVEAARRWRSG